MSTDLAPIAPRASGLAVAPVDLRAAFLAGRKPTTLRAYRRCLDDFSRFLSGQLAGQVDSLDLLEAFVSLEQGPAHAVALAYRADLVARALAPATVAQRLAALRAVVKLARQLGRCRWTLDLEAPKVTAYRDTAGPGDDGWRSLLDLAQHDAEQGTVKALRDLAILRLLHDLALRRGEVVSLDVSHVRLDGRPPTLEVLGKGRTQRERLTLPAPTVAALRAYLAVRHSDRPHLFVSRDGGRMTGEGVRHLVAQLAARAGLPEGCRPHGLRHHAITRVLDRSHGDVRLAQRYARHASPTTTMRYDDNRQDLAGRAAHLVADD